MRAEFQYDKCRTLRVKPLCCNDFGLKYDKKHKKGSTKGSKMADISQCEMAPKISGGRGRKTERAPLPVLEALHCKGFGWIGGGVLGRGELVVESTPAPCAVGIGRGWGEVTPRELLIRNSMAKGKAYPCYSFSLNQIYPSLYSLSGFFRCKSLCCNGFRLGRGAGSPLPIGGSVFGWRLV